MLSGLGLLLGCVGCSWLVLGVGFGVYLLVLHLVVVLLFSALRFGCCLGRFDLDAVVGGWLTCF